MIHIHVVEDDHAVAASLQSLLRNYGFTSRLFETGEAFLAADDDLPSCLLLDVRLPGIDGLAVLDAFRQKNAQTPVIIMTGHGDIDMAVEAMRCGAQDFVEKPFDGDELVERIQVVVERAIPDLECREKLEKLTPRETEVMHGVVAGHQNKVIADDLGISPKTVELHRARVMDKTGATSVAQLVRIVLRGGVNTNDTN